MRQKAVTTYLEPDNQPYKCKIVIPISLNVPIYLEPEVLVMLPSCNLQAMKAEPE
jgi:hypothetical protein